MGQQNLTVKFVGPELVCRFLAAEVLMNPPGQQAAMIFAITVRIAT
jgi:hypothetical protein